MAKATEEIKARWKELGITNGSWRGDDGKIYEVCRGGVFFIHSICVTRLKNNRINSYLTDFQFSRSLWDLLQKEKEEKIAQWYADKGIDPDLCVRHVEYTAQRYHSGPNGGYRYTENYGSSLEKFNELWEQFILGYKEYKILSRKTSIEEDF